MEQCCQSRCFQFKYVVEDFRIGKFQVKMGNENSFTPSFGKQLIFSNGIMRIACEFLRAVPNTNFGLRIFGSHQQQIFKASVEG